MGEAVAESTKPLRRQVAYVCGRWRVTYLRSGQTDVWRGLLVGPLVSDLSTAIWVAVVPDGSNHHTMIRRDSITDITPPR